MISAFHVVPVCEKEKHSFVYYESCPCHPEVEYPNEKDRSRILVKHSLMVEQETKWMIVETVIQDVLTVKKGVGL